MTAGSELVKREGAILLFLPIFRVRFFSADIRDEFPHGLMIGTEIAGNLQGNTPFQSDRLLRAVHRKTLYRYGCKFRVVYPEDQSFREFFFLRNGHHGIS